MRRPRDPRRFDRLYSAINHTYPVGISCLSLPSLAKRRFSQKMILVVSLFFLLLSLHLLWLGHWPSALILGIGHTASALNVIYQLRVIKRRERLQIIDSMTRLIQGHVTYE